MFICVNPFYDSSVCIAAFQKVRAVRFAAIQIFLLSAAQQSHVASENYNFNLFLVICAPYNTCMYVCMRALQPDLLQVYPFDDHLRHS